MVKAVVVIEEVTVVLAIVGSDPIEEVVVVVDVIVVVDVDG